MIVEAAASLLVTALFVAAAVYNGLICIAALRGEEAPSVIPVFGGVFGALGLWIWPYHELRAWAWAPLLLDYGCGYYVAGGAFLAARDAWRYRQGNCFARLVGESAEKKVEIWLYKGGRLRIEQTFRNPTKLGSFASNGKWTASDTGGYVLGVWGASISIEDRDGAWEVVQQSGWFQQELRLSGITLTPAGRELSGDAA